MTIEPLNKEAGPGVYSSPFNPVAVTTGKEIDYLLNFTLNVQGEKQNGLAVMRSSFAATGAFRVEDPDQLQKTGHLDIIPQEAIPLRQTTTEQAYPHGVAVLVRDTTDPTFFDGPAQVVGAPLVHDLKEMKGVKLPGYGPPTQIGGGGGGGSERPEDGLLYPRKV